MSRNVTRLDIKHHGVTEDREGRQVNNRGKRGNGRIKMMEWWDNRTIERAGVMGQEDERNNG